MPRLETYKFALSNAPLSDRSGLQEMIDRRRFLFRLDLGEIRLGSDTPSSAHVEGVETSYECVPRSVASVVAAAHPELIGVWRYAYGFRGTGSLMSSAVAGLAAMAYAYGTAGRLYHPTSGAYDNWDAQQKGMEAGIAVDLGRIDAYQIRYPDDPGAPPERYDTLVTTIDQGGRVTRYEQPLSALRPAK